MTLPLALTGVVLAVALAVITNSVVVFAFIPLLIAVLFVLLVMILIAVVAVVPSNQNVASLNSWYSGHD